MLEIDTLPMVEQKAQLAVKLCQMEIGDKGKMPEYHMLRNEEIPDVRASAQEPFVVFGRDAGQ